MRKRFVLLFTLILYAMVSFAQKPGSTLVVKGESKIFQMPDIMEVNITISTFDKEYYISVEKNLQQLDVLKRKLKTSQISSLTIKDIAQRVNEERSYAGGRSVPSGYRANYQMILQLNVNSDEIYKLLQVLRTSGVEMNYNASFKLSSKLLKSTENRLIEQAVNNARSKAEAIAKASQTQLGQIHRIEYGITDYRPGLLKHMDFQLSEGIKSVGEEAFTQPDLIELTDHVVVTWYLK